MVLRMLRLNVVVFMSTVEVRQFIERRPKVKNPYGRGAFMMISKRGFAELGERLADRSLGMQAVRLLVAMIVSLDYENRVETTVKDLAGQLRMSPQEVSAAAKKLVECGFAERIANRRGWYRISPQLLWMGAGKNLGDELRRRDRAMTSAWNQMDRDAEAVVVQDP